MANRYRGQHAALLLALALLIFVSGPAAAQVPLPRFEADIISVKAKGSSAEPRVDVYTRTPYRNLQFIASRGGFAASYSVTTSFFEVDGQGRRGRLVKSDSWDHTASAKSYALTQSPEVADHAVQSVGLAPGRYVCEVTIKDEASGQAFSDEVPVSVRNFNAPVAMSDLLLIHSYDPSDNSIAPMVTSKVPTDQSGFKLFYEIYSKAPEHVRIKSEVYRVVKSSGSRSLAGIFGIGRSDSEDLGEVTYARAEPTELRAGRTQHVVEIPMGEMQAGEYRVRVKIETEQGRVLDVAEKSITAEWVGLASHIRNVDQAIDQLAYIAKGKDLEYMRAGRTPAERLARFEAFWKKRDPTPGTERNERMEEYYYRIAFANRSYGSAASGWKTDRGQVLVLFGEPDKIERHTDSYDVKPYEVWYYTRIGKRFIFVDESGRGDFRLMVPIWDERNRLR